MMFQQLDDAFITPTIGVEPSCNWGEKKSIETQNDEAMEIRGNDHHFTPNHQHWRVDKTMNKKARIVDRADLAF